MVNVARLTGLHRQVRLVAAGRVAIGAGMLARPAALPRLLGVDSATAERMAWATRMLGVREVVLGAGTLAATRGGGRGRDWVTGGAVSDAVDALAFAGAAARGRVRPVLGYAFAAVGVVAAAGQLAAVAERPRGEEAPGE
jgi:hypothetical protein